MKYLLWGVFVLLLLLIFPLFNAFPDSFLNVFDNFYPLIEPIIKYNYKSIHFYLAVLAGSILFLIVSVYFLRKGSKNKKLSYKKRRRKRKVNTKDFIKEWQIANNTNFVDKLECIEEQVPLLTLRFRLAGKNINGDCVHLDSKFYIQAEKIQVKKRFVNDATAQRINLYNQVEAINSLYKYSSLYPKEFNISTLEIREVYKKLLLKNQLLILFPSMKIGTEVPSLLSIWDRDTEWQSRLVNHIYKDFIDKNKVHFKRHEDDYSGDGLFFITHLAQWGYALGTRLHQIMEGQYCNKEELDWLKVMISMYYFNISEVENNLIPLLPKKFNKQKIPTFNNISFVMSTLKPENEKTFEDLKHQFILDAEDFKAFLRRKDYANQKEESDAGLIAGVINKNLASSECKEVKFTQ